MKLFEKYRQYSARRARQQELLAEMSALSDAELSDLNLSYARITEMSRQRALVS